MPQIHTTQSNLIKSMAYEGKQNQIIKKRKIK